ncbi:metalloregulator ArsR/SmtB family transcription factor [Thermomicrobium sp. 4228-Ro]|uniref:ArsR/SmtB family transcription factor n=1 Tax=Thermomicrobium sp. 4228-Ro TaxID=2993937 RepID=UPI0022492086|nr:metalloregulator ArsR/SmtB family transcription factor [Thermomicrobium sp. 4228-Ro]MCX2726985.1 metalloregulator ArsR/SmtB family transcription factor [Thermomicrobium sp. 4228-Ro]
MDGRCCPMESPDATVATMPISRIASLARALADETRLTLLALLTRYEEPLCVCHLVEHVPVGQPTVSHHLRVLREAGLVTVERRGTWAYYAATPLAQNVLRQLSHLLADPVTVP